MKKLIMGTTNPAKVAQMSDALMPIGVQVERVADKSLLPDVIEDGMNVQENACKKATAYAKALGHTVLSMDNALFLDGLAPEEQPGIHVRRIGGSFAATDAELLDHGIALIESLGGNATGHWEYGVCIADPNGKISETTIRTPRVFTSKRSEKSVPGYPLESIQIDPETSKYISEMTPGEMAIFWQRTLGNHLCTFVSSVF